jgi:hypothetical protein
VIRFLLGSGPQTGPGHPCGGDFNLGGHPRDEIPDWESPPEGLAKEKVQDLPVGRIANPSKPRGRIGNPSEPRGRIGNPSYGISPIYFRPRQLEERDAFC